VEEYGVYLIIVGVEFFDARTCLETENINAVVLASKSKGLLTRELARS
jgi:hypothetical protein